MIVPLVASRLVTLTESGARHSLRVACDRAGVAVGSAELIRLGTNAVFRLSDEVIGRVASPDADSIASAGTQIRV